MTKSMILHMASLSLMAGPLFAAAAETDATLPSCFIKDGDRVAFFGDSITAANAYCALTEQVFRHFHPEAKVTFMVNGYSGMTLAGTKLDMITGGDPNVVTIMMGMNDAGRAWSRGMPMAPVAAAYKAKLGTLVDELKAKGIQVVILTPTLSDATAGANLEGKARLMTEFGKACEEVAKEKSVHCVPVQSELEAYAATLPAPVVLRPDGVHPNARGHYQVARSLWQHLNFAGNLGGERSVGTAQPQLDVGLALATNMLPDDAETLAFTITTPKPVRATVTWSLGATRGKEALNLTGKDSWTLKLPPGMLPQTAGKSVTLVLDVESQGLRRVFVVDVFRKMVVRGKDGVATGTMADAQGRQVCTYQFRKTGKALLFEADVKKQELFQTNDYQSPWGRGDALTLYLDTREATKLSGLGFDGGVYQLWFRPQDKPVFSPGFYAYSGKFQPSVGTAHGARTAAGYKVGLAFAAPAAERDFIGFDLQVITAEAIGKQTWNSLQSSDRPMFLFPGVFAIADLYGKLPGDSVSAASIFPDNL
jgi:lysophospholipase L1-like esterase